MTKNRAFRMKYVGTDGEVGQCQGLGFPISDLLSTADEHKILSLPKAEQDYTLLDLIEAVKNIVATAPPYISTDDVPWVLAYMDDFSRFIQDDQSGVRQSRYFGVSLIKDYATHGTRRNRYEDSELERPCFVDLSRRFTCLEIIHAHLYGFYLPRKIFKLNVIDKPKSSTSDAFSRHHDDTIEVLGILHGEPYSRYNRGHQFPREALDFLEEKRFKTEMSQNFFKRSSCVFLIPDGMKLDFDLSDERSVVNSGGYGVVEVDRFYKTQGGWYDGGGPAGYPKSDSEELLLSFKFIPLLKCNLGEASYPSSALEINIPLSWITHFVKMPHGIYDREFTISKIKSHKYPESEDSSFDLSVSNLVGLKVNKYADEMSEMMNQLYRPRT